MSKLTIKSGKGNIRLRKSRSLVGLKSKKQKDLKNEDFVKETILPRLGGFEVVKLDRGRRSLDKKLDEVRAHEDIELGTHVYFAEGSKKPLVPTGEIMITFQEGSDEEEQNIVLDEYHLELVERRDNNRIIAKVTEKSKNPIKVAAALEGFSLVKIAEPDLDALLTEYDFIAPRDELLSHQWHLKNDGYVIDAARSLKRGADAKVVDAWQRIGNTGSSNVVIAVIDNGFDLTHPDLKNKIYKPYDLWMGSSEILQGDPSFTHGTPCASVALAASNGDGIVGAAPNAKFMPVSGTSFSLRATEEMFNYCIDNGADVISCSWGTTDPAFNLNAMKEEAITKAATKGRNGKGCVVVYAVGNESEDFVSFYSAHPDVIAVGACTSQDEHASYSNKGLEIDVVAPSNGDWPIIAARAWWDNGLSWQIGEKRFWYDGLSRGNRYKHFGGTSSATPLVAGICALMLSVNPDLKASEVKTIIRKTADKIGHPSEYDFQGHSRKYGYGRVNADKAVAEAIRLKEGTTPVVEVDEAIKSGEGLFEFSVKKQKPEGFGVQLGVFAAYGNVLRNAEKFESRFGEKVIIHINEIEGRTVYRMVLGAFTRFSDAKKLQATLNQAGFNGFVRDLSQLT